MRVGKTEITLVKGSLLDQYDLEALVNANNCRMRGGSGINGRFHEKCGDDLMQLLVKAAPHGAPTAQPVITEAPNLKARNIIHVAGPVYTDDARTSPQIELLHTYRNCIFAAAQLRVQSIGFCSISTGIYGFPLQKAVPTAFRGVASAIEDAGAAGALLKEVRFVMFAEDEYGAFYRGLQCFSCLRCRAYLSKEVRSVELPGYCRSCSAVL